jgi:hypothetical protein
MLKPQCNVYFLHFEPHLAAHFPVVQVHVSPQHFLQSTHLQTAPQHFKLLPHLHPSLHVHTPLASLHVQAASQVHFPSADTQLVTCFASFMAQHFSDADDVNVNANNTNERTTIIRIFFPLFIRYNTENSY